LVFYLLKILIHQIDKSQSEEKHYNIYLLYNPTSNKITIPKYIPDKIYINGLKKKGMIPASAIAMIKGKGNKKAASG